MDSDVEYLSPNFDPATLTMPKLRQILVEHDIAYPASAKKSMLVEIFNTELLPRSRKILKDRARIKRTSKGITDMPSSQEDITAVDESAVLMPPPPPPSTAPKRRASRKGRSSVTDESAEETSPTPAKSPMKKTPTRKSSAKLLRTSESESATESSKKPAIRRPRKSEVDTPNVKVEDSGKSKTSLPAVERSAFSDDNPFQSGSSPLTDSKTPRRKSSGNLTEKGTSRRKSSSGKVKNEVKSEVGIAGSSPKTIQIPVSSLKRSLKYEDDVVAGEEFTAEEQLSLQQGGDQSAAAQRKVVKRGGVSKSAPWIVLLTLFSGYAAWWRKEKLEVGYCGVGRLPTAVTNDFHIPDWATFLQPDCEPCPAHAICSDNLATACETDFVLKPHPFSFGNLVPLAPTCEPDGEKVRKVQAVADKAVEELRERRAKYECGDLLDEAGKLDPHVEINVEKLKEEVSSKRRKGMSEEEFEDLWKGAIGEILGRDEVISVADGKLTSTSLARLSLLCAAKRSARVALARYRVPIGGGALSILLLSYIRYQLRARSMATARVPELVALTLNRLATQATFHAQDERAAPEPWIAIGQLRDDVLRDVFSASKREWLWDRVRKIIEMNANVRTSLREGKSGEVSKVWEWIGSVGAVEDVWTGGRRVSDRYSFGQIQGSSSVNGDLSTEFTPGNRWDESRPIY